MRKYLEDIGILPENMPENWNELDGRHEEWVKERTVYGFDERDTWDLGYTLELFLYERLKMYNEVNCIDTKSHCFSYHAQLLTLQDCIDRMLEGLAIKLTDGNFHKDPDKCKKVDSIYEILALCVDFLWW